MHRAPEGRARSARRAGTGSAPARRGARRGRTSRRRSRANRIGFWTTESSPGPSSSRTAVRSFTQRLIRSPVRQRKKNDWGRRWRCANRSLRISYSTSRAALKISRARAGSAARRAASVAPASQAQRRPISRLAEPVADRLHHAADEDRHRDEGGRVAERRRDAEGVEPPVAAQVAAERPRAGARSRSSAGAGAGGRAHRRYQRGDARAVDAEPPGGERDRVAQPGAQRGPARGSAAARSRRRAASSDEAPGPAQGARRGRGPRRSGPAATPPIALERAAPGEERLVAVGKPEEGDAQRHARLDDAQAEARERPAPGSRSKRSAKAPPATRGIGEGAAHGVGTAVRAGGVSACRKSEHLASPSRAARRELARPARLATRARGRRPSRARSARRVAAAPVDDDDLDLRLPGRSATAACDAVRLVERRDHDRDLHRADR